jgi:ribonucleotide reductase alpha subunit
VFLAQEIAVGNSSYPTPEIERNAKAYRQLGLGYANLGALLMARGLAYDSDEGRAYAAAITALMTGRAYRKSAEIAGRMGAFAGYRPNAAAMLGVIAKHRASVGNIANPETVPSDLLAAARQAWDDARSRRGERLPQRPGDRARTDGDDQLHDGLRHDRRRARLLTRQVEEARRRRGDHDRQQDRAGRSREARLRAD